MKLVEEVKFLSPYRKNWVIWEFVFSKMLGLIFLILLGEVNLSSELLEHERSSWKLVSTSFPQLQSGLSVCWKLCLNLCYRRWVNPSRSIVSSFTPLRLWRPKILLPDGLINLRILDLKMLRVSEFRMLESNLIHSVMVDVKYELLNLCFTLIREIFYAFLVLYWQFDCGIISKRYFGIGICIYLKKET